ncbi:MAG: hypothetical protein NC548_21315 [Lachnospiraceae bacterium]|nr:hypothetical protein [Lachnospiraceae bacterium]
MKEQKDYLILFSILYSINFIIGGILQSVVYCFMLNGMFSIISIWFIYFLTHKDKNELNKEDEHVEIKQEPNKPQQIEQFVPTKKDTIHEGVFITPEELKKIKKEEDLRYKQYINNIKENINDLNQFLRR